MDIKSSYEEIYGENLDWENLESFVLKVVRDQQTNIADRYVRKTTMQSDGKFVGDMRIADMIATTPLK